MATDRPEPAPKPDPGSGDRSFLKLVQLATSVSFALMAGFLYSVKEVNPEIKLEFSVTTALALLVTGAATWWAWQPLIRDNLNNDRKRQRLAVLGAAVVMIAGLILATLRALKHHDELAEVLQGALLAFLVLGFVATLLWQIGKLIDRDRPPPGFGS